MLKEIKKILFSNKLMAVLILVFAISIAVATFIENDFGTIAAKSVVYNTYWFEVLLLLLTINLIGNIFKYNLLSVNKLALLTFHVAFIVIIIGSAITRYFGFEGAMRIREGQMNNQMISESVYFNFSVDDGKVVDGQIMQYRPKFSPATYFSELKTPSFDRNFNYGGKDISIQITDFIPNAVRKPVKTEGTGTKIMELVRAGEQGRISEYLEYGKSMNLNGLIFSFDSGEKGAINLTEKDGKIYFQSPFEVSFMKMADQSVDTLKSDTLHPFEGQRLYTCNGVNFVFKEYFENASLQVVKAEEKNQGTDVVKVLIRCGNEEKNAFVFGGKGFVSKPTVAQVSGLNFNFTYGSKYIEVPFNIQLNDFQLKRYPGSMSPASYASEVTLIDAERQKSFPFRIYMNNVLDYRGYRFFQSSYDQDEKGTVLSVNHDLWGTYVTYFGYTLLTIGFIMTLFMKNTRFQWLREKIKDLNLQKGALLLLVFLSFSLHGLAQEDSSGMVLPEEKLVDFPAEHIAKFNRIVVQNQGRMKPFHTLSSEICRKVTGKAKFAGLDPTEMILSMVYQPRYWQSQKMIKVKHPELKKVLGIEGNYASLMDFFTNKFEYKLTKAIDDANRRSPAKRDKFDKEVIEVDERLNICSMVFQHYMFNMFPKKGAHPDIAWDTPGTLLKGRSEMDSLWVSKFFYIYGSTVEEALTTGDWAKADSTISFLAKYQLDNAAPGIMPSQRKLDLEVGYNKQNIFIQVYRMYGILGFLLLIVLFVQIFGKKPSKIIRVIYYAFFGILAFTTLYHLYGLIVRWYISGHAPWSNGYEAMVYIAFATMLAGFIFSRNSKITLAATAILAALILWVASLNFMNPTITNLVPVLDSYWLMIHVALITASYGFLGLACILALINICVMLFKNKRNRERINLTLKELTYVNEMTVTVGLFMLTVGTFLGGVWANESWGRYWGWDPKETWAMVSVLVYAFVAHMRLVPGLRGLFTYNLATLWAYGTIIMTYFGVNYYLSGLHSYAKGDPVPFPDWAIYTIIVFAIISIASFFRNRAVEKGVS